MKAVGAAVLVQMLGFAVMSLLGWIKISPTPFFWAANLVGSFIFGIGMVLAGGCASGVTYRVGEGMLSALSALLGLTISATMTAVPGMPLAPIKDALQKSTKMMVGEANPTLANILGLQYAVVAIILAVLLGGIWIYLASKNKEDDEPKSNLPLATKIFKKGWGWLATGIVIGLIGMLAFVTSTWAGRSYPLAITSGWITFAKLLLPGEVKIGWDAYLVLGIVVGAFIAAIIASEFKIRWPGWGLIGQTFVGGLLMGFGAVTSAGCNVTHILSGLPQLGIGSIVASIAIVLGAWVTGYLMFVRK